MEEFFGFVFVAWVFAASVGALDNMVSQTPDSRIIAQCKEQGYLNVKQTVVTCSIEKEPKKEK